MPLYGELDLDRPDLPVVTAFATADDEWSTEDADILTVTSEIDAATGFKTVPPALHPSLPPYVQMIFRKIPDGPFGPCITAEINVRGRSTIHQVGYCVAGFTDNAEMADFLRKRYGQPVREAEVSMQRRYHGVEASVAVDGRAVVSAMMTGLHYISPTDVLFTHAMNLAKIPDGRTRLVQMELEYTLERAERGTSRIETFDATTIGEPNLTLTNPLPPTLVRAREMRFLSVRYLVDPAQPAMQGTEKIAD